MITQQRQTLVSVGLGVVAGLLVVNAYGLLVARPNAVAPAAQPPGAIGATATASSESASGRSRASSTATDPRVAELEARLKALEANAPHKKDRSPTESATDRTKVYEHEIAVWNSHLADHDAEPVDPKWAAQVGPMFDADFKQLSSDLGIAAGAPDCRSKTCTVAVEWPTYGDAVDGYGELLHHEYGVNCQKFIVLPNPPDGKAADQVASYSARILFSGCQEPTGTVATLDHSAR